MGVGLRALPPTGFQSRFQLPTLREPAEFGVDPPDLVMARRDDTADTGPAHEARGTDAHRG